MESLTVLINLNSLFVGDTSGKVAAVPPAPLSHVVTVMQRVSRAGLLGGMALPFALGGWEPASHVKQTAKHCQAAGFAARVPSILVQGRH